MRTKLLIAISAIVMTGMISCEKSVYDPDQSNVKVTDLVIPDDFDWKMVKDASCNISSDYSTNFSIYQDEACSENGLLANVSIKAGDKVKLPLSVLSGANLVYVKYAGGVKTAAINAEGEIDFKVPEAPTTRAGETDFEQRGNTYYFPNAGGGTVMFEDNYPLLGDYDFNDFVALYTYEVNTKSNNPNLIDYIEIRLEIRAIGATKVYVPHLRLKSYGVDRVEKIELVEGDVQGLKVELLSDAKASDLESGKMVLAFNGAEDKGGMTYFNTEKGTQASLSKKLSARVYFKDNTDVSYLKIDGFDLFLATKDRKLEIHALGNGTAFSLDNYKNEDLYKDAGTNLVWAINVPKVINHAYERGDFLKAYPDFKTWAESANASKWYDNGNNAYLFQFK